ncbi:MAG: hypothetical protein J0M35_16340 [Candidatus Obscuribacter phosphatis]|uniref:Uncharacterized protein n=1 Tax=Candidatus Obscuribacter phosphatis TaxID=1906157 RepID=A0A8J7PK74_9BACT|nr:hypothetical protein [Candidatus Obscuribacter phosphatis]
MKEGFDASEISEGLLAESTANSNVGKSFDNPKSPNDSSPQSDAALPPSEKSPAGELGPETSASNASVASPNQEFRSPASADAAKTSKAQPSKDPIRQSLADSFSTNNAPADLYSRKVVGWSISNHVSLSLHSGAHPLVHSDCGSQYASTEFRNIL